MKKQSRYFVACFLFLVILNKTTAQPCTSVPTTGTGSVTANPQGIVATDLADIRVLSSSCNQQSEVSISIDKNNPCFLVASANILNLSNSPPTDDQGYYYSSDGGLTWQGSDIYPSLSSYNTGTGVPSPYSPNDGDPSTAFDGRGYGFISTMENTYAPPADPQNGFYLVNSKDNGTTPWVSSPLPTWSNPATAISGVTSGSDGFDRPSIAADNEPYSPNYNNVYCVGTEFINGSCSTGNLRFFTSTSNGASFPAVVTDLRGGSGVGFGWGANVQTGPTGEIYVAWAEHTTGTYPAKNIGFALSTDGGNSWTHDNTKISSPLYSGGLDFDCGANAQPGHGDFNHTALTGGPNAILIGTAPSFSNFRLIDGTGYIRMSDYVSMAVDKSCGNHRGRIYMTYHEQDASAPPPPYPNNIPAIVQVIYSDDNGANWTLSRAPLNPSGFPGFFPWIAVDDKTGIVSVIYYCEDQTDSKNATNTYVAFSSDGGVKFESIKVSDLPHLTAPLPEIPGIISSSTTYMGDYIGITAHNGKAYAAWMDNRINSPENAPPAYNAIKPSIWQIYVSEIDYSIPSTYTNQNYDYNVVGPTSLTATAPVLPQIYQAQHTVVVPSISTFASASGTNVIVRAGTEVTLTNGFSTQNEMHAYIEAPLTCFTASCSAINHRLSANNSEAAPMVEPIKEIVVPTKLGSHTRLSIYPNPSSGLVYLNVSAQTEGNIFVNITTLNGNQVLHTSFSATEGANNFKVDLCGLTQGVYFIKITDENGTTIKNDKLMLMGQ